MCIEIGVSEDTVRRDLQELGDAGRLIKVHGGALSNAFSQVQFKPQNVYSLPHKRIIATKAINLIKDGMFILTSGGTTILEMIRNLPVSLKATIMTGSIPVVNACLMHPSLEVIVVGDRLSRDSKITVGSYAVARINQVNADLCFLGTNAIHPERGLTDNDWEVVQVKQAMISSSTKVACLTISEKLNSTQPIKVCNMDILDYLITELEQGDEKLNIYNESKTIIL